MDELAKIGQTISIFIVGILYCAGWMAAGAYLDKKNDSSGLKVFAISWLIIHGIVFVVFLLWSWT